MVLVGEIAASPAFTVSLHGTVVDAARVMRDKSVGDVVVVGDDRRIAGMLTDRDIAVRVVAAERDPAATEVEEVCTPNPVTVSWMAEPEDAERLMREHLIHRLPVVDEDERPVGVLSLEDLSASLYIDDDHQLRELMRTISRSYQLRSASIP